MIKTINKKGIRPLPAFGRMTLSRGQEKSLDELWAKAVKARASGRCEKCGYAHERLEAHHAVGRRNKTLRHIISNGFSLCHSHHRWAEQDGIAFAEWAIKQRGQAWWDGLKVYGREIKIFKEYSVVKNYLEAFL